MPTSSEKPPVTGSPKPEVSSTDSKPGAIAGHRNDIFFAAIETTRMPMIVTDPHQPDNPIIFANRAFLSMTGYAPEEITGVNCRFLQGPGTDRNTVAGIREAIEQRREHSTEILNYRKDGSTFWNALFLSPVFNEKKELVYYFASQLDVSRRRDAEEALAQSQKMEALGQLTGGISHDFNNLLQVIAGQLDLLNFKLRVEEIDREKCLRNVDNARQSVTRAASLTQQLLAFSRKQRLEGRPINLNATANGIVDIVEQAFGNQGGGSIDVQLKLEPDLHNCQLDPSQLEVALLNVLLNARDAMPQGGKVTIKTANVSVDHADSVSFGGLPEGDYVSISVTDSGTGIPKEIIQRVMDPFFTTKEEGKGTGLGLSMVYGFAKQSGGTAQIYSELGLGTTVRLFFPATQTEVRPARGTSAMRTTVRGGSERILVVDDRPEVAKTAEDLLTSLGYHVTVALGANESLGLVDSLADDEKPQLLFTDIIMPGGMNGISLARAMRERVPGIRILLTTGYAGDMSAPNVDVGSEFDLIYKPYRLEDMARKIRAVLGGATGSNLQPG
ncbi:MAG: histidine kinase famiy protein [Xylophilus ampelinus]